MKQLVVVTRFILAGLTLLGLTALPVLAKPRPFHLVETGTASISADGKIVSNGTGTATHLGRFHLHREATLTPIPGSTEAEAEGTARIVAANGDVLLASIKGVFNPSTGQGVLIYEWTGGSGRFEDATGTTVWLVTVNPDLTYDVVANGVIDY